MWEIHLWKSFTEVDEHTEGEIQISKGKIFSNMTNGNMRELRRHMQIIFQDPFSSLNFRRTIGQSIEEPLIVHKCDGNEEGREK